MSNLIDMSKLTRRKVDMNVLPDSTKTLQQRIYEEAIKRVKNSLGNNYGGISLISEFSEDSYLKSFEDRVDAIVKNTLAGRGKLEIPWFEK